MKTYILILVLTQHVVLSCSYKSNNDKIGTDTTVTESLEVEFLHKFYNIYNETWNNERGNTLKRKTDSLKAIYCSRELYSKLSEISDKIGLDHDQLIGDFYKHQESIINVSTYDIGNKIYLVTYYSYTEGDDSLPKEIRISLLVKLINEDNALKINQVNVHRPTN